MSIATPKSNKPRLTRNQIRGFWAAWGGWALDGMDSFIYAMVLVPALRELLPRSGIPATTANVGFYGGVLFACFLVGWGLSLIWGPIADRFGRVRTLSLTIIFFSVFTLLSALSTSVWVLAAFRLLAGVGIGGEWSMAGTFVAEEWPEERRKMGAGLMHTGYYFGFFLAALANYFIGNAYGWRAMFVLGGLPALFVAFIRYGVNEPSRWANKHQSNEVWTARRSCLYLFSPEYRRRTILNSTYMLISIVGLWAGAVYVPASVTFLAATAHLPTGAGRGAAGVLCHDDSFRRNYSRVSGRTGHSGTHWAPGNAGDLLFFDADIYFAWLWLCLLSERRRAHLVHGLLVLLGYRRCELCNLHIMGSRAISDGVSGQRLRFFHFRRAFCGSGHYVFSGRGRSPFSDDWHPGGSNCSGVCDWAIADSIW